MANSIRDSKAPYNFIRLPINAFIRYGSCDELPKYDSYKSDLNTGYIDYEFKNETPIFIGSEKLKDSNDVAFFKNVDNKFCVPGSSMRGVVRKNTEILGFGYPDFIEDQLFLYRKFASTGAPKNEYKNVITAEKGVGIESIVRAGYIYKDGKDYKLISAKEVNNKTFFSIKETVLRKMNLPEGDGKIRYMYSKDILKFKPKSEKTKDKDWEFWAKRNQNKDQRGKSKYKPYTANIKFEINDENKIEKIKIVPKKDRNGVLFNSNHMGKKKNHYIINEIDTNAKVYTIGEREILAYQNDCDTNKQRKNAPFYFLPKKNGIEYAEPFFYIIDKTENVSYFGKCPYLRIFFSKSIRECIKVGYSKFGIDYPSAIFGYTVESNCDGPLQDLNHNFKSRVSFTDVVCEKANIIDGVKHLILSSPKPTSYTHYLMQNNDRGDVQYDDELITYNNKNAEIRGSKFYWMKNLDINKFNTVDKAQERVATNIKNVLDKNSKFKGKIYFENLTDDELGLLLLSLKYNDRSKESIGMGKPYGFGRINIDKIDLYIEDIESKFTSLDNCYKKVNDIEKYKKEYKNYINKNLEDLGYDSEFDEIPEIQDYIGSKTKLMDQKDTCYMGMGKFKEWTVLPEAYRLL